MTFLSYCVKQLVSAKYMHKVLQNKLNLIAMRNATRYNLND